MPQREKLAYKNILNDAKRLATLIATVTGAAGPHNILSATHSDATTTAAVRGDIIIANNVPAWTSLAVGGANEVLATAGVDPAWTSLTVTHISDLAYAAPNLTLGLANAVGAADTVIRTDATILVFDAANPTSVDVGDAAVVGVATVASRRDHQHAVTSSSNPGAAASLLATDANGDLTLEGLIIGSRDLDMNGNDLILDADADTKIEANVDNIIKFWANGGLVAYITTGVLQLSAATHIVLQDDGVIGLGVAGGNARIHFDGTPATDMIIFESCEATFDGNIYLDDGATDSPHAVFVGGTNDDAAHIFLDDNPDAGKSDLVIQLCDTAGDSALQVRDSVGVGSVAWINSDGESWFGGDMIISTANLYLSDASNAFMTQGITINQGANDNEILAFKSSDVAHGITTITETDTYARFHKIVAANGGLSVEGFSAGTRGAQLIGTHTTDNTAKTAGADAAILLLGRLKDGTGTTDLGADANIVAIYNNGTCRFIFDAEGSAHAEVEWVVFDDHDDLALLATLERTVVASEFGGWIEENKALLESLNIAHFDETPGHAMVNWTRLSMLLTGACKQLHQRLGKQEERLNRLLLSTELG